MGRETKEKYLTSLIKLFADSGEAHENGTDESH